MNRLTNALRSEILPDRCITAVVDSECPVPRFKTKSQHMDKTAPQDGTDLHPAPKSRNLVTTLTTLVEPVEHGLKRSTGMVISHSEMTETTFRRLFN